VAENPKVTYFKPRGIPLRELEEVYLGVDGFEALRLADLLGLSMEDAAGSMGVSRHTFGRILARARRAVAEALVHGLALRIEGGPVEVGPAWAGPDEVEQGPLPGCAEENAEHIIRSPAMVPAPEQTMENQMHKIAISSEGPALTDLVDPRFGRAAGYVIVDTETMASTWVDNGASQAMAHGAGIKAAERVARAGAKVLLTGVVGPKAAMSLKAAGISVVEGLGGVTVQEAIDRFRTGAAGA